MVVVTLGVLNNPADSACKKGGDSSSGFKYRDISFWLNFHLGD